MKKRLVIALMVSVLTLPISGQCYADNFTYDVKEVQQILIDLGYLTGLADGVAGAMTKQAVEAYQTENSLDVTGEINDVTYDALLTSREGYILQNMPEGMSIDEEEWQNWEREENACSLGCFVQAGRKVLDYTYTVPVDQESSAHKKVDFVFKDGGDLNTLKDVEMYYCDSDAGLYYVGLWTEYENILYSNDFKEACVRLMLGYNSRYSKEEDAYVLDMSRERAEEIVSYCIDNKIEHCLVDGMRIRSSREQDKPLYSFHIER